MNDDDHKPDTETTGPADQKQGQPSPGPSSKKKPAQRAAPRKKAPAPVKAASAKRQPKKAPRLAEEGSAEPAAAAAPHSKLDLVWAITGVVFYSGVGLLILFVLALLAIVTLLLRMASDDGQATSLDARAHDLKVYGAEILQFLCAPLGPMPFPFAPWPGKSDPS